MNGWSEAHTVIIPVVDRVVELHKYVSENVELLQAALIHTERLNDVATLASLRVLFIDLSCHPVMRGQIVF